MPQIAINISARQFGDDCLPGLVGNALQTYGLTGAMLELELTETLIMSDPERTIGALEQIRALGLSVSIDDFGTGYSSLAYMRRFPVSSVKIDRSFIAGLPGDEDSATIVGALIGLGHNLGLKVVAEGVESMEQHALLRQLGCNEVQGYAIAQPLPADACTAFLRNPDAAWVPAA